MSLPIRYLIGQDASEILPSDTHITEYPYDIRHIPKGDGQKIAYGNLLDEEYNTGIFGHRRRYGPYSSDQSGTPEEWGEGRIDTHGDGYLRYLNDQFKRARDLGFHIIELDNADSYHLHEVIVALQAASHANLMVIAKNPLNCEGTVEYLRHPAIVGAIIEYGCGSCANNDRARREADKTLLPMWFVSNHSQAEKDWANRRVRELQQHHFPNMGVTWCPSRDDYSSSVDLFIPITGEATS